MLFLWGEEDSNLRSRRQQIYSLPQLAALVSPLENAAKKDIISNVCKRFCNKSAVFSNLFHKLTCLFGK